MFSSVQQYVVFFTVFIVIAGNSYAANLQDPLRPPQFRAPVVAGPAQGAVSEWYVNEILISGERRVAIVNDRAVAKGEKINGAKVVDITPAHVVLEYKDKTFTAHLGMLDIKKRSVNRTNQ